MSKLPEKNDPAGEQPDLGRRRFFARLGLAAIAAYAAPTVLQIGDEAQAQRRPWSDSDDRRRRRQRARRRNSWSDNRRRRRARSWSDNRRR